MGFDPISLAIAGAATGASFLGKRKERKAAANAHEQARQDARDQDEENFRRFLIEQGAEPVFTTPEGEDIFLPGVLTPTRFDFEGGLGQAFTEVASQPLSLAQTLAGDTALLESQRQARPTFDRTEDFIRDVFDPQGRDAARGRLTADTIRSETSALEDSIDRAQRGEFQRRGESGTLGSAPQRALLDTRRAGNQNIARLASQLRRSDFEKGLADRTNFLPTARAEQEARFGFETSPDRIPFDETARRFSLLPKERRAPQQNRLPTPQAFPANEGLGSIGGLATFGVQDLARRDADRARERRFQQMRGDAAQQRQIAGFEQFFGGGF